VLGSTLGVAVSLAPLPDLLSADNTLSDLVGLRNATLAVVEPARAFVLAGLAKISGRRPLLILTPTTSDAEKLANDLRAFLGELNVDVFPAWETLPFERVSPSVETMGRRLRTMWHLRSAGTDNDQCPEVVVAPVKSVLQRLGPHVEETAPVVVNRGDTLDLNELVETLVGLGYRREYQVEHRGELAVRGSIVDVFPSTADAPVRIDLWGDEVDRLSNFSVQDQRSTDELGFVELFGCRELRPTAEVRQRAEELMDEEPWGRDQWERLEQGSTWDGMESWLPWLSGADNEHLVLDLVPRDALIVLIDPRRMRDRAAELLDEEAALAGALARTWGAVNADGVPTGAGPFPQLHLPFDRLLAHTEAPVWTMTTAPEGPQTTVIPAMGWNSPHAQGSSGDGNAVVAQLKSLAMDGYRIILAADGEGSADRIQASLREDGIAADVIPKGYEPDLSDVRTKQGRIQIVVQPLERGFIMTGARLAVLSESDITGRRRSHRKAKARKREAQAFFDDLQPGSFVVHHVHGVGKFEGMVKRLIGGVSRDYLLLSYRGDDKLYVPSDQIDTVRHYVGEPPSLHKLGGKDFATQKARVRSAVREIAQELVVLYQTRISSPGHAFGNDTPWQREMEDLFPYAETPDQLKAIEDVKADMESTAPMDRLVCGDVGYGKTEVAIRAIFKAVQDGKQAAILVPTTLLAQQHFSTFSDRFANYPIRVEVLSRFLTTSQQKKVILAIKEGLVDVVVGTHRLLGSDIEFARLGLLVVDEEQRFGVTHKESIKQMKANVDVLTLTATPIPRTLEMALTGIRDLTLLNTAPAERQPILTYVGEYDDRAVAEAIRRELLREGQVFYVHNRVSDIEEKARALHELVPEARIAVAHGQMDEGSLEQIVYDFYENKFDVLVCTTIIETGIDMPTVNTLVVDRADRMGLGQLHQLRGRVGRSGQRAYAYLFYPADMQISEIAHERLKTIGEHTELGSGFKIAMRDLEIRGAGNLLGGTQSGHIAAVGYDLYSQMVIEAVSELKGETIKEPAEIKLEVPIDASIPHDFIAKEPLRLEAYRRLANVTSIKDVDDIRDEWLDRYGPIPEQAAALLDVGRLRAECVRIGIRDVTITKASGMNAAMMPGAFTARMSPVTLKTSQELRLQRIVKSAIHKPTENLIIIPMKPKTDVCEFLVTFLGELFPRA
jgi:transcription-repair coupling factor (superfamily II helicase)